MVHINKVQKLEEVHAKQIYDFDQMHTKSI